MARPLSRLPRLARSAAADAVPNRAHRPRRRLRIAVGGALLALVATAGLPAAVTATAAEDLPSLREEAEKSGILFGSGAINPAYLDDPEFARILAEQFNSLSPENELKWSFVQPQQGVFNFAGLDRLVRFAREHGMEVKGHGLVSSGFNPGYVTSVTDPDQLRQIVRDHFETIMKRYKNDMDRWDVVTEALSTFGGQGLTQNHFHRVMGPDYIAQMFRIAHDVNPKATLFYNENLVEYYPAKRKEMYDLISGMVASGVPIDGVGLQMHAVLQPPAPGVLTSIIEEYEALGLEVAITELDVHTYDNTTQAYIQGQILAEALAAGMKDISTWGFTDKYGYALFPQPGAQPPLGTKPNIFDAQYNPKPSFFATHRALVNQPCWITVRPDCYATSVVENTVGSVPALPAPGASLGVLGR